ncbi:Tektin-B1 [Schistosoma japonicum]|uniref:Tektin n=1 Tax=Schistosoma japonicum TaxID=6182 RepID=A0A4Z2CNE3_SCHJA|nr:Tektin-B1 [Schistosoma japonicum]
MATVTKLNTKETYSTWFENLHAERKSAEDARNISYNHRQLVKATQIETDVKTKYEQFEVNNHLSNRIWTVRQWRDELTNQLNHLKQKENHLKVVKNQIDEFMMKLNDSFDVNIECLTHLDHRRNGENIIDSVFEELNKEHDLLKELQMDLQQQIDEVFHLLVEMNDAAKPFYIDILDKNNAVQIDVDVYNLNEKSSNVCYKPFCERLPGNSIDLQTWENISYQTVENAKNAIGKADDLLHRLHNSLHKAINRMISKANQVNSALRMRMHDTLRALHEIEYQMKSTEEEKDENLKDIRNLEDNIRAKKSSLKLNETQLEKRHDRPRNENILDAPHVNLLQVISNLRNTIDVLEEKLAKSRSIVHDLQHQITQLHHDKQQKLHTLQICEEISNIRKRLDYSTIINNESNSSSLCPMIPNGIIRQPIVF